MKKLFLFMLCSTAVLYAAKYVTATRASQFIMECLSAEEVALIQSTPVTEAEQKRQLALVAPTLACVSSKQTVAERLVTRLWGIHLFAGP